MAYNGPTNTETRSLPCLTASLRSGVDRSPVGRQINAFLLTAGVDNGQLSLPVPFIHAAYGFGQVEGVPAIRRFGELDGLLKTLDG